MTAGLTSCARSLPDLAATDAFGAQLAQCLRAGDVIALSGDLGAGKTRLVQAVARALGVPDEVVNSPTFVLIHEYSGRIPLRHCDVYRLRSADEFAELGLEELFSEDGAALVEWADRVAGDLPSDRLEILLQATGPHERRATLTATGPRSRALLECLSQS